MLIENDEKTSDLFKNEPGYIYETQHDPQIIS